MARGFIGSRQVKTMFQKKLKPITPDQLQAFRDEGRRVTEQDGAVEVDEVGEFRLVPEGQEAQPQVAGDDELEGLSEGNELTGFNVQEVNRGKNELTDFDAGQMGQSKGGNDLIDFK